jgi:two-component sensor histidine kinase
MLGPPPSLGARIESPHLVAIDAPVPLTRATPEELASEVRSVASSPLVGAMLDAFGGGLLLLNAHRQIVAANLQGLVAEHEVAARAALGLRPGEALGCIHAAKKPGGCGATEACRTCGALKTILGCQARHMPVEGECLVTTGNEMLQPFELRLRASPTVVDGRPFVVLAVRDASDEKRRTILERVFFHDLLNSLSGLSMSSQLLLRVPPERARATAERIARQVSHLEQEIVGQRTLLNAEHGTLELNSRAVSTGSVLRDLLAAFSEHPLTTNRSLSQMDSVDLEVHTDLSLLFRVLTNMVTNALEATSEGGSVRVSCTASPASKFACAFLVHNEAVMPRHVAAHVFQRSFSTKANKGRGLGTYSMKLLGERYLGGEVTFTSREGEGTTFSIRLPKQLPGGGDASKRAPFEPCF